MIGIYKITSPSKKIYIGQSINIKKRFSRYKTLHLKSQTRLERSFLKYGVENHVFEIIEECSLELLNIKERYYQDFYNATGANGLNCFLTKTDVLPQKMSLETIEKIRQINLGRKHSEITKQKHREYKLGTKMSIESRKKLSESKKGILHSEESKIKMSLARTGLIKSAETRKKLSERMIGNKHFLFGKKHTEETKLKLKKAWETREPFKLATKIKQRLSSKLSYTILDTNTGVFYYSMKELSQILKIPNRTISYQIQKYNHYKGHIVV